MSWYLMVVGLAQIVAGMDVVGTESGVTTSDSSYSSSGRLGRSLPQGRPNGLLDLLRPRRSEEHVNQVLPQDTWLTLTTAATELVKQFQPEDGSSLDHVDEGRKIKKKKQRMLMALLIGLKVLAAGILLPSILALALYASWKGVTISLLAFMLAATVGVKSLLNGKKEEKHHVIVAKPSPSVHEHIWRKEDDWFEKDHSPYRAYASRQLN